MSELHPDALVQALQSLAPNPGHLDRDRLMFEAGRHSTRPSRLWPAATMFSTACAAVLAGVVVLRPSPEPVVRVVEVRVPLEVETTPASTDVTPLPTADLPRPEVPNTRYARLQDHVLRWGLDIPALPPMPDHPQTVFGPPLQRGEPSAFGSLASWLTSRGTNQ